MALRAAFSRWFGKNQLHDTCNIYYIAARAARIVPHAILGGKCFPSNNKAFAAGRISLVECAEMHVCENSYGCVAHFQDIDMGVQWVVSLPIVLWLEPMLRTDTSNAVSGWILQTGTASKRTKMRKGSEGQNNRKLDHDTNADLPGGAPVPESLLKAAVLRPHTTPSHSTVHPPHV